MSKNNGIRPINAPAFMPESIEDQSVHTDTIEDDGGTSCVPAKFTPRAALTEVEKLHKIKATKEAKERDKQVLRMILEALTQDGVLNL